MNDHVKCYCISLKENEQQRTLLTEHLNSINIKHEYYMPERSQISGTHGCFMSHIEVLKMGLKEKHPYILVLEDDVYFDVHNNNILDDIYKFVNKLKNQDWCFCFGYVSASPATKVNSYIYKLPSCKTTHAYLVPRRTAKKLIKMNWKEVAIDFQWQEEISTFYVPYPMIAFQHDHPSSVSYDIWSQLINRIGFKGVARLSEKWCVVDSDVIIFYTFAILFLIVMIIYTIYFTKSIAYKM